MANSNDMFIPELWAETTLMIMEGAMVLPRLVHRDFENRIQNYGDTVNTRKPATFTARRKDKTDSVTVQDAQSTNVAVVLDQLIHTSFRIYDGEESLSLVNLIDQYLRPAGISMAQNAERVIAGETYAFLAANSVGALGTDITEDSVINLREKLNTNMAPSNQRYLVVPPTMESSLLKIDSWTKAQDVGDNGYAMREGYVGRKFGFDVYMDNFMPSVATGNTVVTGAVNNSSGYAAGSTAITVDGLSAAITAGTWCTIAGDMTPQQITGSTGGATPTAIAITPGLRSAVVNDAVLTMYAPGAINLSAGYAAAYGKELVVDGFTVAPKSGQLITLGSTTTPYSALNGPTLSTTGLWLNKPLAALVANDATVNPGPAGNYGLAFNRNALAFVNRPLALPMDRSVKAAIATKNNLSMRIVISYDAPNHSHLVTLDMLAGVKVLDTDLGVVCFG